MKIEALFKENFEEEPIEIEPEEEPTEIEPEEEPIEIEPEEEPIEIEPIEEEPIEIEPIEEEPIEIEPIEEEPIEEEPPEEEPIEEELVEEPIEDEPVKEEPYEEPVKEPFKEEPYEEPFEDESVEKSPHEEETPLEKHYEEKDLSKERRKKPSEVLNKEVPNKIVAETDKQEYHRTLTKTANYENLKEDERHQLQYLDKNYESGSSVQCDKNQSRVPYKQHRPGLPQTGGSKGEIDPTYLYVGNFPQSLNSEDLEQLFSKFGPIAKIYVAMDNDSGLNNGYGFVKFTNAMHAVTAIDKMNGYTIMGMPMKVQIKGVKSESSTSMLGQGSPGHEVNKAKLFVEHLPLDVTRPGLIKMFQNFGTIATAYLVMSKTRSDKVYGYVIYSDAASAARAMADMNGHKIGVNILHVTIASNTLNAKESRPSYATNPWQSSQPRQALPCPDHAHVRKRAYEPTECDYKKNSKYCEDHEDLPGYKKRYRRQ